MKVLDYLYERAKTRYRRMNIQLKWRLEYELATMRKLGQSDYVFAKAREARQIRMSGKYLGPGRGRSVASLICYVLQITDIDPIENDFLFEVFMYSEQRHRSKILLDTETEPKGAFMVPKKVMQVYLENPPPECLSRFASESGGHIMYIEQLMLAARELVGLSRRQAGELRRVLQYSQQSDYPRFAKMFPKELWAYYAKVGPYTLTRCCRVSTIERLCRELPNNLSLEALRQHKCDMTLPIMIGWEAKDKARVEDLAEIRNQFVYGVTGSGKSVFLKSCLYGLEKIKSSENVQFALYDEKQVEFSYYNDSPYLWRPVAYDVCACVQILHDLAREMWHRLETKRTEPRIVFVADECSDLFIGDGGAASDLLSRIAKRGYEVGIHLMLATSRLNACSLSMSRLLESIPCRIAFKTCTCYDSIAAIGSFEASQLRGKGDLLYKGIDGELARLQGPMAETESREVVSKMVIDPMDYARVVAAIERGLDPSISALQEVFGFGFNYSRLLIKKYECRGRARERDGWGVIGVEDLV